MARFRLGRWDGFVEDLDVLERMLGDRRREPPYFAVRPFGAAAVMFETRGEPAAADRMLAVVEWMRGQGEGRGSLALAFASLALARRGDVDAAWAYSDEALSNRRAYGPAVWETRCDLVAETGLWDRTPEILKSARAATDRGRLLALPAFADRLEGRTALMDGETEKAKHHLDRASRRFEGIGARWERAATDLSLAETLLEAGDRTSATARLEPALTVFDEVGSLREADRARELLQP
jgi:tetratricopeptide (TPR) repeat protein